MHAGRTALAFSRRPTGIVPSRHPRGLPVLVSEVSRRAGVFDYAGLAGNLALSFPVHAAFRHLKSVGTLIGCFRSSIALPTYTSVYASLDTSRSPVQNSRPSGSLFLSRKALSSSASDRFIPAHLNSNKSTRSE